MPFSPFRRSVAFAAAALIVSAAGRVEAYGPIGHQIVGAIADERLAGTPTGAKIQAMLQGFTLQKASVIPDEIKGWDAKGPDDPHIFHYSSRPQIDAQLSDFWRANPPAYDRNGAAPSHRWFHYADVPVANGQRYGDGKTGRSQWDVVQMISYSVAVLGGDEPEENARKITKPIAIILLTHLVGDLHQPLHVGAQYFNEAGKIVDPDKGERGFATQGGNTIMLQHFGATAARIQQRRTKLHGFWDTHTVMAHLPDLPKEMPKEERRAAMDAARKDLVARLAKEEPKDWRLPADVKLTDYAETWADDILPTAREAHERLEFREMRTKQEDDQVFAAGTAREKPNPDGLSYYQWSAAVVAEEMHKAGWRLADLLEQALR